MSVDIQVLIGLIGNDRTLVRSFLDKFLLTVPVNISEIHKSLNNLDYRAVKAGAHKLKSSANVIGAQYLSGICQSIENYAAVNADAVIIEELINKLVREFDECKVFIDNYK